MLLTIQFPLADSRRFLNIETGLLNSPAWPSPSPDSEFVRSFGSIRRRKRGGINGWLGENELCEANRAIRFIEPLFFLEAKTKISVKLRCSFRRFFFDGLAMGKFEIGISTPGSSWEALVVDHKNLVTHLLSLLVEIRTRTGERKLCQVGQAGPHLADLYASASSKSSLGDIAPLPTPMVKAGRPLLFLDFGEEIASLSGRPVDYYRENRRYKTRVTPIKCNNISLFHWLVTYKGTHFPVWELAEASIRLEDYCTQARTLRLYMQRLHAEHECLRSILKDITSGNIPVTLHSEGTELLQLYLNEATRRISRYEARSDQLLNILVRELGNCKQNQLIENEIADLARESEDIVSPGQRDGLLNMLKIVGIRKNILRKLENYTDCWNSKSVIVERMEVHMGDVFKNINNSIIATRGAIAKGIVSLKETGHSDIANAISDIDRLIAEASTALLPAEKKAEGADLLHGLTEEVSKPQPNRTVLRALGNSLITFITQVEPIAKAAKSSIEVIKSLWS